MGHFSVYCQISKITITGGQEAVMLPLRPVVESYREYAVALLPMFGKYNDYANIELNKEETSKEYEELIQKYYNCSVQEFANNLVHINREELKEVSDIEKYGDLTYCWIDRKVWEYITNTNLLEPNINLGYPELLEYLGFSFIREDKSKERHKLVYSKDNKEVYSDGTWLEGGIYYLQDDYERKSLVDLFTLDKIKIDYIKNKYKFEIKEIFSNDRLIEFGLFTPFGIKKSEYSFKVDDLIIYHNNYKERKGIDIQQKVLREIIDNINPYYHLLVQINKMYLNFHVGTYSLEPYISCQAPQDGEYQANQKLLDKFADINKSYIYTEED